MRRETMKIWTVLESGAIFGKRTNVVAYLSPSNECRRSCPLLSLSLSGPWVSSLATVNKWRAGWACAKRDLCSLVTELLNTIIGSGAELGRQWTSGCECCSVELCDQDLCLIGSRMRPMICGFWWWSNRTHAYCLNFVQEIKSTCKSFASLVTLFVLIFTGTGLIEDSFLWFWGSQN